MEEDEEFVYLALEQCKHSLADMITMTPSQEHLFVDSEGWPTSWCMQVRNISVASCLHYVALHITWGRFVSITACL